MGGIVVISGGTAKDADRFRTLADQAIALVEDQLPGTVLYEFYLDPDASRFAWHESYADSAALMTHMQTLMAAGLLQQLPDVAEFDFALCLGEPSPEVREALAQLGFQVVPAHAEASR